MNSWLLSSQYTFYFRGVTDKKNDVDTANLRFIPHHKLRTTFVKLIPVSHKFKVASTSKVEGPRYNVSGASNLLADLHSLNI